MCVTVGLRSIHQTTACAHCPGTTCITDHAQLLTVLQKMMRRLSGCRLTSSSSLSSLPSGPLVRRKTCLMAAGGFRNHVVAQVTHYNAIPA